MWRCYYTQLELTEAHYDKVHGALLSKLVMPQLIPAIQCLLETEGIRESDSTVSLIVDTLLSVTSSSYGTFLALEKQLRETPEEHLMTAFYVFRDVRTDLVNTVQTCFVYLFVSVWYDYVTKRCLECKEQLANQLGHTCLTMELTEERYRDDFCAITCFLVMPRLIPAIQWHARAEGMQANVQTVRAIVDTLLSVMSSSYDTFVAVKAKLPETTCEGDTKDRFTRLLYLFRGRRMTDEANVVDEEDTPGSDEKTHLLVQ